MTDRAGPIAEQSAVEQIARLLAATIHRQQSADHGADAELHLGDGSRLLVAVKRLRSIRRDDIRSRLALGLLELRRHPGGKPSRPEPIPIVALVVPQLTPVAEETARAFMTMYGERTGWALLPEPGATDEGGAVLSVPALGVDQREPPRRRAEGSPRRRSVRLFSDLNRWMLKVLLLRDARADLWSGPREEIGGVRQLALVAKVSLGAAQSFVRAYEKQGYLSVTRGGIGVIRRADLLRMWMAAESAEPPSVVFARWIFGPVTDLRQLVREGDDEAIVGGFEAARRLGVLHAIGTGVPLVHISGNVGRVLTAWDLETCEPRDAHVRLSELRYPESVRRGAVLRDGLRVADVLQVALDVVGDPGRGHEQSDYVLRHVLGWEDA